MIEIKIKGEAIDLPEGFSIEIEETNPVFNERGSQTVPATVPVTRRNARLLGAPQRIDAADDPNLPQPATELTEGGIIRSGVLNVTEADRKEGITFNIGFDNSTVYAAWEKKKLPELSGLPEVFSGLTPEGTALRLNNVYHGEESSAYPFEKDMAIFPVAVSREEYSSSEASGKKTYWEILNIQGDGPWPFSPPATVKRIINGEPTDVKVPPGYGTTPFLRVWRVLELVFSDMGLTLKSNPFYTNPDLRRLVVLNNTADAICRGKVSYAELMPDCTVEEFMNALWVRFGLVYDINFSSRKVALAFIRDIISRCPLMDITGLTAGTEKIIFPEKQYIKLSAQTSIEGAAPSVERWEDFTRGIDTRNIHLGRSVNDWKYLSGSGSWNGDERDDYDRDNGYDPYEDYDPDYDYPEPLEPWEEEDDDRWDGRDDDRDDDRDDGRDDDRDQGDTRSGSSSGEEAETADREESTADSFLAREFVTGSWYLLDENNGDVKQSSSSFFNWDPQTDGLSPLELSSDDECVPVGRVSNTGTSTGHSINALMPLYLVGSRHFHSYIKGSDSRDDEEGTTPLAFMFAFTTEGGTVGRLSPEGDDGMPIKPSDGSTPRLSLYWQFRDGLFSRFWKEYDEFLRHGNRQVETTVRLNKYALSDFDMLSVYNLRGVRCLPDTLTYSLPAGNTTLAELRLRTLRTQGSYDIKSEQRIPPFSSGTRSLGWGLYKENFGERLATDEWKALTVAFIRDMTGYEDHGPEGNSYRISAESIVVTSVVREGITWMTDPELPSAKLGNSIVRKYNARVYFDVYEVHDTPQGSCLCDTPLINSSDVLEYTVVLRPLWISI